MSQRQKRKLAREGAARLKRKPGWDPSKVVRASAEERLRALDQDTKNQHAYQGAEVCGACDAARAESGDETALCDEHLREAMGF